MGINKGKPLFNFQPKHVSKAAKELLCKTLPQCHYGMCSKVASRYIRDTTVATIPKC